MSNPLDADLPPDLDDDAARSLTLASEEAELLGHDRVGTEHLLLGLLATEGCSAAQSLSDAGASLAAARHKVAEAAGPSTSAPPAGGRTARATRALHRAVRFSHARRSEVVTTDHILLGVLDVEGTAGQVLRRLGVDVQRLRDALDAVEPEAPPVLGQQPYPGLERDAARPTGAGSRREVALTCPSCGVGLRDRVALHDLTVGTGSISVIACATCGAFLGVAPA